MKRTLLVLLAVIMLVSMVPVSAFAVDTLASGVQGTLNWKLDSNGLLTVSGSGAMSAVQGGYGWQPYAAQIRSIRVEDGVTSVGKQAFAKLPALETVELASSVERIENEAFSGCKLLGSIDLGDGVKQIGVQAFFECGSLTAVDLPKSLEKLGVAAFLRCANLEKFTLDSENEEFATDENGVLYSKDKTILHLVPGGWTGMLSVPEGVYMINPNAFQDCDKMMVLSLPGTVEMDLWRDTLPSCDALQSIQVSAAHPDLSSDAQGLLYSKNMRTLYCVPAGKNGEITLNGSVTAVASSALSGCTKITKVVLPQGLKTVGDYAFENCSALTEIALPDTVTRIGAYAFSNCKALKAVTVPAGVTKIENDCFGGCESLKEVVICGNVAVIEEFAFSGCSSLKNINLPASLTRIGEKAFFLCGALRSVKIPEGVTVIEDSTFWDCASLAEIVLPESLTQIKSNAFAYCVSLNSVEIPSQVKSVGVSAFIGCEELTQITLPQSLTAIGSGAFSECAKLAKVYYNGTQQQWQAVSVAAYNECLLSAKLILPHEHIWGDWVITKQPNHLFDGEKTAVCEICGQAKVEAVPNNPFADVASTNKLKTEILWAYYTGITTGVTDTTFEPNTTVNRGQAVTFLWRAAGCPEPKTENNPFTDVGKGAYYYKAILWAVENGITNGTTATTFSPKDPCKRRHIVMFLYRYAGQPPLEGSGAPFPDVSQSNTFYNAVMWAVEEGITNGTKHGTFDLHSDCTRAQVVTFLYRHIADNTGHL